MQLVVKGLRKLNKEEINKSTPCLTDLDKNQFILIAKYKFVGYTYAQIMK